MADPNAEVPCLNCGRKMTLALRQLSSGNSARCPACGCLIKFEGEGGRQAQRAIDDLNNQIRRLSRTLKIKL